MERGAACRCTLDGALTAGCAITIFIYYTSSACVLVALLLRCHHCQRAQFNENDGGTIGQQLFSPIIGIVRRGVLIPTEVMKT